ncbi:MAG TPA: uroporphyrinogen-III synthase [Gemmatimonadales bacterium]|nr:uroporphyrinogen-III synthase [Gemmatimonadales bacterium]
MPPWVVLTGAADGLGGGELAARLEAAGVAVRSAPLLDFAPPERWDALDAALAHLGDYAALVVTSPRAAAAVAERLAACAIDPSAMPPVWAVGDATARPLAAFAPRLAGTREGAALAEAMVAADVGSPVLFPCGDRRLDVLPGRLRAAGRRVDEIVCYRTRLADEATARRALEGAALVVVASPSVARLLAAVAAGVPPAGRPRLVSVGPSTAAALVERGWPADRVAETTTPAALAEAALAVLAADGFNPGMR